MSARGSESRTRRETAFRAAELAVLRDHVRADIPGGMDDDGARLDVANWCVEPEQAARAAVRADIDVAGEIGALRRGGRTDLVGEAGEEAGMLGIRAAAVRDEHAAAAARGEIDDVEARLRRGQVEIDQRHLVALRDAVAVPLERGERAPEQIGSDRHRRRRHRRGGRMAEAGKAGVDLRKCRSGQQARRHDRARTKQLTARKRRPPKRIHSAILACARNARLCV